MKKIVIFGMSVTFLFVCNISNIFAQGTLNKEQLVQSIELRNEYKEQKAELDLQLKKLEKDREIAKKDQNASLVERRTREIKQTRERMTSLAKEYGGKHSDILTEEQKVDKNIYSDFYAKELAAEQAKIVAAEKKSEPENKAAAKKNPAPKKKAPAKK